MDTITFADGSVYNCSFCATTPEGRAFVALSGVSFAEAATVFSDPSLTGEMTYSGQRMVGYTQILGLYMQPYGIQAVLMGGHVETITEEAVSE